ncbi:DNA replication ATP-dependent helicase/nuclease DNA2 [Strongylocentrotus purpuratus]|uniref:DNA replication ATP-dependent helicase/nuclease DNA2 n=1 Tax=Strongylocentrotus purpuratus TaxID=7668 RepID=A0A7M7STE1_STRPU|nr:DNA replication ATP-dependent helicase/nuclease DNA2 [Strongylocentrotus purpuratus]XP_030830073.1 DNA replication ATP-dependent helicase/nuclease DNA2 [Strongylocentrotus purpuratus]
MGKPTKTRQPSKGDSQSKHGHQSSLDSFFRKKSELPSPLFTQVISTSQKSLKKQKDGISSRKPAPSTTAKVFKQQPASSLPWTDQHDVLVIPATPDSMQPSPVDRFHSPPKVNNPDTTDSPFSQAIIPDTPENVLPKKRPFTSLLNHSRDVSSGTFKQDDGGKKDSSNKVKFGKDVGRVLVPLLRATNSEVPKMKVTLKGSVVNKDEKVDKDCSKVEKKSNSFGVENVIASNPKDGQPKQTKKLSRLSRKGNKLVKLNKEVAQKPASLFENEGSKVAEMEGQSAKLLQECQDSRIEIKPAVCRVRNSSKKNASRLSLSKKVQKDLLETSIRAVKRSPSRGNSPYSKRFQDSEDIPDETEPSNGNDGIERVRKSLLHEYGSDSGSIKEMPACPEETDHAASVTDALKHNSKDTGIILMSSGDVESNCNGDSADHLTSSDQSLFSNSNDAMQSEHASSIAEGSSGSLPLLEKVSSPEKETVHFKESMVNREGAELEEFVSVIPDSCPTPSARQQDILLIPDTCPLVEDTPEKKTPQDPSSPVHRILSLGTSSKEMSASQEFEHKVQSKTNTANENEISLTSGHQSILQERRAFGGENEKDKSGESLHKPIKGDSRDTRDTMALRSRKSKESSGSKLEESPDDQAMDETALQGIEIDIVQDTPLITASKDFSTPGKAQHESMDHETNVTSPGTAALLEGLDDSFLDDINLDELNDMQDGKMKEVSISNIDKKFGEMSPFKKKPAAGSKLNQPHADLCRYLVTGVQDSNNEKKMSVRSMSDQRDKICILKDTWQGTLVEEGMVVAIHGTFGADGVCELNNQSGYLVVNPDHLLTGTAVSNSIRCMRRSVLSEHFKGLERGNRAMLLGSLLHEVFDQAILKKEFQKAQLMRIASDILKQPAFLCDMYSLKVDEDNLLEEVGEYADTIKRWSDTYLGSNPRGSVDIKWPGSFKPENCGVSVSKVTDIEESIWSPRWGVKGKVDLTVEVKIHRPSRSQPGQHANMPLELKTGKETNSIEHRSQLILYSLMLGDLQPTSDLGFLLYIKTSAMKAVPANHLDKRELIHLRNQLAYYLSRTARSTTTPTAPSSADWPSQTKPSLIPPILPEPIRDDFSCKRCAHLQACSSLHKLEGSSTQLASSVQELFTESIEHLPDSHLQYFAHWYLLCCLEHEATKKRNKSKNIWCKESTEREKDGECWSHMEFMSATPKDQQSGGFTLIFRRKQGKKGFSEASLDKCFMKGGDRVVISEEGSRRVAICVGFIDTISKTDIKISSDSQPKKDGGGNPVYRIDKDDSYNSMAASLVNLTKLMKPEHNKLRNIVIDKRATTSVQKPNLPARARGQVATIMRDLNEDQRAAIKAVLRSQDYTVIIGMPGTGKTTTIVALVRILVACGMSVLLTSYTHSAVDNILLKLLKYKIDILRLGAQHNIHPELREFSDSKLMKEASGVSQLAMQMERKKVVATTSLGMKHALLTRHSFDVCIVDEASQISQPVCLGPLFSASKFVLVGDQCQLPPLVQSSRARDLGMDESLFQRLVSAHTSSVTSLSLQFRMHSEIMSISNHMVYDGAMRCGNDEVAKATISLPNWDAWCKESCADAWLEDAVNPSTVVSFLNTDQAWSPTDAASPSNTNRLEAILVRRIVESLMQAGCTAAQIGVISPYRRQCQLLTSTLADLGSKVKSLEVNTVDKYQGRDKDVIVMSFSHSQTDSQGGSILNDLRRLNVAMTRAKHKLLLIGSLKCLSQFDPVQKLISFLQQNQLVRNLPHDAVKQTAS